MVGRTERNVFKHGAPVLNVDHKLLKPVIKPYPGSQEERHAGLALNGKACGREVGEREGGSRSSSSVLSLSNLNETVTAQFGYIRVKEGEEQALWGTAGKH